MAEMVASIAAMTLTRPRGDTGGKLPSLVLVDFRLELVIAKGRLKYVGFDARYY